MPETLSFGNNAAAASRHPALRRFPRFKRVFSYWDGFPQQWDIYSAYQSKRMRLPSKSDAKGPR